MTLLSLALDVAKNDAENKKKKKKKKSPGEICEMALSWVEGGAGIQRERGISSHTLDSWKLSVGVSHISLRF